MCPSIHSGLELPSVCPKTLKPYNPKSIQDVPILVADPYDGAAVGAVLRQAKVVVCVTGPFAKYANTVVEQCVEQGTHYCDITGKTQRNVLARPPSLSLTCPCSHFSCFDVFNFFGASRHCLDIDGLFCRPEIGHTILLSGGHNTGQMYFPSAASLPACLPACLPASMRPSCQLSHLPCLHVLAFIFYLVAFIRHQPSLRGLPPLPFLPCLH